MKLNRTEYRNKVLGCWLGKNVGGVVGAPYEWKRQVNDISFYTHTDWTIPGGRPMANDDLDIQLLWLVALEEIGLGIRADRLAEYWCTYVTPHWAEYGTAKINMRQGIMPPLSGTLGNEYKNSCGSYIRSEIWACIAPGAPETAARYAYEDAILDHGDGEGTYAEIFMAATESAAFVCGSLDEAVKIGLTYIPKDCGVAQAVRTAYECFEKKMDWKAARLEILKKYRGLPMPWTKCSPEDAALGLADGPRGYDVPSNIALTLVGLLWGGADFGQVMCICVNCGEDTDCTAATAGALWGILHGADALPQKWLDPIGRSISTKCLNLGELWTLPQNVDDLTDRTLAIAEQMQLRHPHTPTRLADDKTDTAETAIEALSRTDEGKAVWGGAAGGPRYEFDLLHVHVDYGASSVLMAPQCPKTVKLTFKNVSKIQHNLNLHWYLPEGWSVAPGPDTCLMLPIDWMTNEPPALEFTITAEKMAAAMQRAVLEITIPGRPTVMHVPLLFLNAAP